MTYTFKLARRLAVSFLCAGMVLVAACEPGVLREGFGPEPDPDSPSSPTNPTFPPTPASPSELPRVFLDTDYQAPTGQSVTVPAGGNLQAALNAAQPGDEIVLEAGATYRGTFTLPEKSGSGWIIVRSSAMGSLPGEGQRVGPGDAGAMAKLEAQNGDPALRTAPRARQWRIMGLEITAATSVGLSFGIVRLGSAGTNQSSLSDVAKDLILDRVYVHGHPNLEVQRCVALNSASSAVIDSYLSECHIRGFDSQAIAGWNGPGPFKIVNNYLEGAGENVMFGGAPPRIPNLVPSDIEIRRNHFYKPLAWQAAGWTVKNLFELKNAERVLVEGNVFENNWVHAQTGFAILFQATLNGGNVTWARVRDITFRYNRITNSAGGINLLSRAAGVAEPSMRISFTHNVLEGIGFDPALGSNGILLQLLGDHQHVVFTHNTGFSPFLAVYLEGGGKVGTIIQDNILQRGAHGVGGRGTSEGTEALTTFDPSPVFAGNIVHGGVNVSQYPPDNYYPSTVSGVGFVNYGAGDYRLQPTSPYAGQATDATDPGADLPSVQSATAGVIQ